MNDEWLSMAIYISTMVIISTAYFRDFEPNKIKSSLAFDLVANTAML